MQNTLLNWWIQLLVTVTDEPSVTVAGEGTYTINPTTGEVTFTPEPSFTGTAKGVDCFIVSASWTQ